MQALAHLRLPLLTTEAVLTELFHFVGDGEREVQAAWRLVHSQAITLASITDRDLPELRSLMDLYSDRPMDFADATLVHLAQRERLNTVFTIDFSDFQTYRINGRQRFRIIPDPPK
jgi:predicted nucleic acid-binding protein